LKNNKSNTKYSIITNYQLVIAFLIVFFVQISLIASAQQKLLIKGIILDKSDNSPIPFSNIMLFNSRTGTISQNDGMFSLQIPRIPDTLIVSAIGYTSEHIPIINDHQVIYEIKLTPADIELGEVVILPKENQANMIMRKVIELKPKNNPLNANTIACNTYTKVLANSVSEKENKFHEKNGLPIFFSEKYSQNYIQRVPFHEKEHMVAEKLTGLGLFNELDIFGLSTNVNVSFNFYENIVEIFDKPFISPLSNRAFLYYHFYVRNTTVGEFGKEYVIEFVPKNINDLAFKGYLKVIDQMWAVSEISTKIPIDANLNYINKLEVFQTFIPVNDTLTFYHINELTAELKITKDNALANINFTTIVDKRTIYSDVQLNFPPINPGEEDSVLSTILPVPMEKEPDLLLSNLRPEVLSTKEKKAIALIDSVNNNWKIKTADALSRMFITGYIPGKYFDLGPYLELIKHNKIEGYRFTLSGRTSSELTKNTMLYGHIGYGITDRAWKYGIGLEHKFNNQFRRVISLDYRNDLSRIGDNRSIFLIKENMMVTGGDNVIAAFFTNDPLDKLSREISYRAEYEHEWRRGLINMISISRRTISSGLYLPFIQNEVPVNDLTTNEMTLGLRLSWEEGVTDNYCRRWYMATQYPIINFRLTGGKYQIGEKSGNFLITRAVVNHDVNIGLTKFEYVFEGGITLGTIPFPLLEIHRTDQSLGYSLYYFNLMKEMEFASDRFLSIMAQYHLNGLFFNRIPLLKKVGLREVFSAKVLWSHLDNKHQQVLEFPSELKDARLPYTELSAGIENIFQYFRADFVFRLTNHDIRKTVPVGVRVRFDFSF
jgi:hypothetical protein